MSNTTLPESYVVSKTVKRILGNTKNSKKAGKAQTMLNSVEKKQQNNKPMVWAKKVPFQKRKQFYSDNFFKEIKDVDNLIERCDFDKLFNNINANFLPGPPSCFKREQAKAVFNFCLKRAVSINDKSPWSFKYKPFFLEELSLQKQAKALLDWVEGYLQTRKETEDSNSSTLDSYFIGGLNNLSQNTFQREKKTFFRYKTLLLHGENGSGKTTLIEALARSKGAKVNIE